jgi:hypothetical protein
VSENCIKDSKLGVVGAEKKIICVTYHLTCPRHIQHCFLRFPFHLTVTPPLSGNSSDPVTKRYASTDSNSFGPRSGLPESRIQSRFSESRLSGQTYTLGTHSHNVARGYSVLPTSSPRSAMCIDAALTRPPPERNRVYDQLLPGVSRMRQDSHIRFTHEAATKKRRSKMPNMM